MARSLNDIIASLPQERQDAIHQGAAQLIAEEMTLRQLRKARERSQQTVAAVLKVNQAAVSKIEHRADMYISTLRSYIEAMGGELEIIAHFPNHTPVQISQFEDLGSLPDEANEEQNEIAAIIQEELPVIYELRTYWAAPGKSEALHQRFRSLTLGLFDKHRMQVVGFWTPETVSETSGDLVYLLAFPDREAMEAAWTAFRADPEWVNGKAASEVNGLLTSKVASQVLLPTDYSPLT